MEGEMDHRMLSTIDDVDREIEAVLPDATLRVAQLSCLAESLRFIHERQPDCWLTHLRSDLRPRRLRLFAGRLIVLTLEGDEVWLATDGDAPESAFVDLRSWRWDEESYPEYRRPPSRNGYYQPSRDPDGREWKHTIREAHFTYLERWLALRRIPDQRSKQRHEPLVVEYIEKTLGQEVSRHNSTALRDPRTGVKSMNRSSADDSELSLYQLHCRYAIRGGIDMAKAAALWQELKSRNLDREAHLTALFARLGDASPGDLQEMADPKDALSATEGQRTILEEAQRLSRNPGLRNRRLKKDNYQCQHCGFKAPKTIVSKDGPIALNHCGLDVHHVTPVHDGERRTLLEDLVSLCPNCHRLLHAIGKALELAELPPDLLDRIDNTDESGPAST